MPTATGSRVKKDKARAKIEKKNNVLKTMKIVYMPLEQLVGNSYNPNRQSEHDFELLCASIEEDGFTQPILAQATQDANGKHQIIDGEHRWRAAHVLTELGKMDLREIPVVLTDMNPAQARISTFRHNRARGSEDIELAALVFKDLQELGAIDWALDSLQIDTAEFEAMMANLPAPEVLAGEDYTEAWEPAAAATGLMESAPLEAHEGQTGRQDSMTLKAVEAIREQERKVREGHSEEEKMQARKDLDVFRLSLVFLNEEAEIVRLVLGEQPAEGLLKLCIAEKERRAQ